MQITVGIDDVTNSDSGEAPVLRANHYQMAATAGHKNNIKTTDVQAYFQQATPQSPSGHLRFVGSRSPYYVTKADFGPRSCHQGCQD